MERLRPEFEAWRTQIDPDDEDDEALAARFLAELPEADAALLRARRGGVRGGVVWEALRQPEGYLRDAALLFREWDFHVADVRCPTTLWVGEADEKAMAAVPWWTERLPAAELRGRAGHHPPGHPAHPVAGDPPRSAAAQQARVDLRDGRRTSAACSNAEGQTQQQRLAARRTQKRHADRPAGRCAGSRPARPGSGSRPGRRSRSRADRAARSPPRRRRAASRRCRARPPPRGRAARWTSYAARSASWSIASACLERAPART